MSHASQSGFIRRLLNRCLPGRSLTVPRVPLNPSPAPSMDDEETGPIARADRPRPPLFAVRDHAVPGQEYARLLSIPEALEPEHRRAHLLAVRGLMHARQARQERRLARRCHSTHASTWPSCRPSGTCRAPVARRRSRPITTPVWRRKQPSSTPGCASRCDRGCCHRPASPASGRRISPPRGREQRLPLRSSGWRWPGQQPSSGRG